VFILLCEQIAKHIDAALHRSKPLPVVIAFSIDGLPENVVERSDHKEIQIIMPAV